MIVLTNRGRKSFVLNCDLIESIESIPETKITLTNERFYLVEETADEIIEKIIEYKQLIYKNVKVQINRAERD